MVQAVSEMTRAQLRGAIGYASYAIPRLIERCEKLLASEGDEGVCSPQLADAVRRLKLYRLRLEDARAEWNRRGYVVRSAPKRNNWIEEMHERLDIE